MADSARAMTPSGVGTPRSPRVNEAAAGAAAARPFVQRLRASGSEGEKILDVVKEAERAHDNLYALSEIYGVAVEVYAKAQNAEDDDLSDLSVKRMRMLCRLSPSEAREFHNRLRAYSTGRADARMYEARAGMEERLGDTAKAIKMLQEGLKVGAQPEETLRRQLKSLLPTESQSSGDSYALTPRGTRSSTGQASVRTPPRSPRQASQPVKAGTPPARLSPPPAAARNSGPSPARAMQCAGAEVAPKPVAAAAVSTLRPRSLGGLLGPPTRRSLNGDDDDDEEEWQDEEEDAKDEEEEVEDEEEDHLEDIHAGQPACHSTTMSVPLSPIQEQESLEEATCESCPHTSDIPPPGSTAPTPQREAFNVNACTPRREALKVNACTPRSAQRDVSTDSGTPCVKHTEQKSQPTPSASSGKSIFVNGVAYSKLQKLGQGGSSKVYLVRTSEGQEVALKRVETDCPKQFEGYQNEVDLLLRLKGHEHVIQVLDAEIDRERGRIHIVMEAGDVDLHVALTKRREAEGQLSLAKLQDIWRQMLQGLQVIHNARIVHSDLKPGNFVFVRGKLKVIDFGIAKRISNDTTNICRENGVGTLSYMAPEAIKMGKLKIGRASDIWSLGIILFQMVYNRLPFNELEPLQRVMQLSRDDLRMEFPEDHCLAGHSSATRAQLLDVLAGCLQRDPRRRPSLSHLLAHPLLRTAAEVKRETLQSVVTSVIGQAVKVLGDSIQAPQLEAKDWQTLADEVWEQVSTSSSQKAATDLRGLAPVTVLAKHLKKDRDAAWAEAAKHKARNQELEDQLRRLQQQLRGPGGNELKDLGQVPRRLHRPEDKENMVVMGYQPHCAGRGVAK